MSVFNWLDWIDVERSGAEARLRSEFEPDSGEWHNQLIADSRYGQALAIYHRHMEAATAAESAQLAEADACREAREFRSSLGEGRP